MKSRFELIYLVTIVISQIACIFRLVEPINGIAISNHKRFGMFDNFFGSQEQNPEPDWNSIKHRTIKLKARAKAFSHADYIANTKECIKKCIVKKGSDVSLRDNCLSKMCDIY